MSILSVTCLIFKNVQSRGYRVPAKAQNPVMARLSGPNGATVAFLAEINVLHYSVCA